MLLMPAAASRAAGSLLVDGDSLPESTTLASAACMLMGGLQLVVPATLTGEWADVSAGAIDGTTFAAFLWLVVGGSLVCMTAYTWLMRNASRPLVASDACVNPA